MVRYLTYRCLTTEGVKKIQKINLTQLVFFDLLVVHETKNAKDPC